MDEFLTVAIALVVFGVVDELRIWWRQRSMKLPQRSEIEQYTVMRERKQNTMREMRRITQQHRGGGSGRHPSRPPRGGDSS